MIKSQKLVIDKAAAKKPWMYAVYLTPGKYVCVSTANQILKRVFKIYLKPEAFEFEATPSKLGVFTRDLAGTLTLEAEKLVFVNMTTCDCGSEISFTIDQEYESNW